MAETLALDDLFGNIAETVAEWDGELVARLYNTYSSDNLEYVGDSLWSQGGSQMSLDDVLNGLSEIMACGDGENITVLYHSICSDRIKYLGDSMWEKVEVKQIETFVDVLVRVRVTHDEDVDPSDVLCESDYGFAYEGTDASVHSTDMLETTVAGTVNVDDNSLMREDGGSGRTAYIGHVPPIN